MSETKTKFPTRVVFAGILSKLRLVAINPSFEWLEKHGLFLSEAEKSNKHRDYASEEERTPKDGSEPVKYRQCKYDLYFQLMPGSNGLKLAAPFIPEDEKTNPILIRKTFYVNDLVFNKKDTNEPIVFTLDETGGSYDKAANTFYTPGAPGTYQALNGESDLIKFLKLALGLRAADAFSLRKDAAGKDLNKASEIILLGNIDKKGIVKAAVDVNAYTYIDKKGYQGLDSVRNYGFFNSKPKDPRDKSDFIKTVESIAKKEKIAKDDIKSEMTLTEHVPGKVFVRGMEESLAICMKVEVGGKKTEKEYESEMDEYFGGGSTPSTSAGVPTETEDEDLPF